MIPLHDLLVRRWPGAVPAQQPPHLTLTLVRLCRREVYSPREGSAFFVVSGKLRESLTTSRGREFIVRDYATGHELFKCVGVLRAEVATSLVEIGPGWERELPELAVVRIAVLERQVSETTRRLVQTATENIAERVKRFAAENPGPLRPQHVARCVGASREMCSRVLKELGLRE